MLLTQVSLYVEVTRPLRHFHRFRELRRLLAAVRLLHESLDKPPYSGREEVTLDRVDAARRLRRYQVYAYDETATGPLHGDLRATPGSLTQQKLFAQKLVSGGELT